MKYHAAFSIRLDPPRIEKNVEKFELFFFDPFWPKHVKPNRSRYREMLIN